MLQQKYDACKRHAPYNRYASASAALPIVTVVTCAQSLLWKPPGIPAPHSPRTCHAQQMPQQHGPWQPRQLHHIAMKGPVRDAAHTQDARSYQSREKCMCGPAASLNSSLPLSSSARSPIQSSCRRQKKTTKKIRPIHPCGLRTPSPQAGQVFIHAWHAHARLRLSHSRVFQEAECRGFEQGQAGPYYISGVR